MAATSALIDNFNDNAISTDWVKSGFTTSDINEQNQRMEIAHTNAAGSYNNLDAAVAYDLTGSNFFVQVVNAGNQSIVSHEVTLGLALNSTNATWMLAGGGNLSAYRKVAGTQTQIGTSITYSSTTHAWWRIREASGTTFYDTSTDGSSWTNRWSVANPFAITAIKPYLQSGCWQAEASGSFGYFDNFNVASAATNNSARNLLLVGV